MIIFEENVAGRTAHNQLPPTIELQSDIPMSALRSSKPLLPELSELQVIRHFTRLSQKNFSIDTHFYPLGSCTMKYNPRGAHGMASLADFLNRHPLAPLSHSQGFLGICYEFQQILSEVTGMPGVSLTPMAGAQGEFVGVAMIRAYHEARGDLARTEILVPDAAHGTNPASAVMCGYEVREIATGADGDIDLEALQQAVGPQTAGIMLTNPSTLGVFEQNIQQVAAIIHKAGGLLYYDGANFNAILGKTRPGDMGFDVIHLNLHKTFATPHGGGGPGSGPVTCSQRLLPYLPVPRIGKTEQGYEWLGQQQCPQTMGRLSAFMGNAGIVLRAAIYARLLGREGLERVAQFSSLNANYLMKRLSAEGFQLAFPERRASHEFLITLKTMAKQTGVTAKDFAKRLLDYGFHAPTTYFPLLVPECLLIEPTETECLQELDRFVDAMVAIKREAETNPELVLTAPHTMPVKRLDDVKAVKELDVVYAKITEGNKEILD